MDVFVKICGIASYHDAVAVAALRPDALGFVLWSGSPRGVEPEALIRWLPMVRTTAWKVGVFVEPDPAEVDRIVRRAGLDVVQIHSPLKASAFAGSGARVWRAIHADRLTVGSLEDRSVDAWVADTYSKEAPGGTGNVGNWEAIRALKSITPKPVVLAGGLKPGNVCEALRVVRPWGVDVSSGVESVPGQKNLNGVKDFIEQCRTA